MSKNSNSHVDAGLLIATDVNWTRTIAKILLGTLFLTIAAKISIAVWPVPVTLQSFAVAVFAAVFGWRIAVATVVTYLCEGAVGLPVFASGGGVAQLIGPTGGFLLGFIPMAFIIGKAARSNLRNTAWRLFASMIVADAVLFMLGFIWLIALSGSAGWIDQANVVASAFERAVAPFLVWDALKMALATTTAIGVWSWRRSADNP